MRRGQVHRLGSAIRGNPYSRGNARVRGIAPVLGGSMQGSSVPLCFRTRQFGGRGTRGASGGASGAEVMGPQTGYHLNRDTPYCSLITS